MTGTIYTILRHEETIFLKQAVAEVMPSSHSAGVKIRLSFVI